MPILNKLEKALQRSPNPPDYKKRKEYKTKRVIGIGTYGVVKEAIHIPTGEVVALKIIKKNVLKEHHKEGMVDRELKILKKIRHPNIVEFKDYFETKSKYYISFALATGGELFDRICQKGKFTEKDAAIIITTVVGAVSFLHSRGIVHRDIKPENLLYKDKNPKSELLLCDFGISKMIDSPEEMLTTVCGSPGYTAPEILKHEPYSKPVDMWSIGVITYTLLCGYSPFHYADDLTQLYNAICHGRFTFDTIYWAYISRYAKDFIKSLLQVQPEKRLTADEALQHTWLVKLCPSQIERVKNINGNPISNPNKLKCPIKSYSTSATVNTNERKKMKVESSNSQVKMKTIPVKSKYLITENTNPKLPTISPTFCVSSSIPTASTSAIAMTGRSSLDLSKNKNSSTITTTTTTNNSKKTLAIPTEGESFESIKDKYPSTATTTPTTPTTPATPEFENVDLSNKNYLDANYNSNKMIIDKDKYLSPSQISSNISDAGTLVQSSSINSNTSASTYFTEHSSSISSTSRKNNNTTTVQSNDQPQAQVSSSNTSPIPIISPTTGMSNPTSTATTPTTNTTTTNAYLYSQDKTLLSPQSADTTTSSQSFNKVLLSGDITESPISYESGSEEALNSAKGKEGYSNSARLSVVVDPTRLSPTSPKHKKSSSSLVSSTPSKSSLKKEKKKNKKNKNKNKNKNKASSTSSIISTSTQTPKLSNPNLSTSSLKPAISHKSSSSRLSVSSKSSKSSRYSLRPKSKSKASSSSINQEEEGVNSPDSKKLSLPQKYSYRKSYRKSGSKHNEKSKEEKAEKPSSATSTSFQFSHLFRRKKGHSSHSPVDEPKVVIVDENSITTPINIGVPKEFASVHDQTKPWPHDNSLVKEKMSSSLDSQINSKLLNEEIIGSSYIPPRYDSKNQRINKHTWNSLLQSSKKTSKSSIPLSSQNKSQAENSQQKPQPKDISQGQSENKKLLIQGLYNPIVTTVPLPFNMESCINGKVNVDTLPPTSSSQINIKAKPKSEKPNQMIPSPEQTSFTSPMDLKMIPTTTPPPSPLSYNEKESSSLVFTKVEPKTTFASQTSNSLDKDYTVTTSTPTMTSSLTALIKGSKIQNQSFLPQSPSLSTQLDFLTVPQPRIDDEKDLFKRIPKENSVFVYDSPNGDHEELALENNKKMTNSDSVLDFGHVQNEFKKLKVTNSDSLVLNGKMREELDIVKENPDLLLFTKIKGEMLNEKEIAELRQQLLKVYPIEPETGYEKDEGKMEVSSSIPQDKKRSKSGKKKSIKCRTKLIYSSSKGWYPNEALNPDNKEETVDEIKSDDKESPSQLNENSFNKGYRRPIPSITVTERTETNSSTSSLIPMNILKEISENHKSKMMNHENDEGVESSIMKTPLPADVITPPMAKYEDNQNKVVVDGKISNEDINLYYGNENDFKNLKETEKVNTTTPNDNSSHLYDHSMNTSALTNSQFINKSSCELEDYGSSKKECSIKQGIPSNTIPSNTIPNLSNNSTPEPTSEVSMKEPLEKTEKLISDNNKEKEITAITNNMTKETAIASTTTEATTIPLKVENQSIEKTNEKQSVEIIFTIPNIKKHDHHHKNYLDDIRYEKNTKYDNDYETKCDQGLSNSGQYYADMDDENDVSLNDSDLSNVKIPNSSKPINIKVDKDIKYYHETQSQSPNIIIQPSTPVSTSQMLSNYHAFFDDQEHKEDENEEYRGRKGVKEDMDKISKCSSSPTRKLSSIGRRCAYYDHENDSDYLSISVNSNPSQSSSSYATSSYLSTSPFLSNAINHSTSGNSSLLKGTNIPLVQVNPDFQIKQGQFTNNQIKDSITSSKCLNISTHMYVEPDQISISVSSSAEEGEGEEEEEENDDDYDECTSNALVTESDSSFILSNDEYCSSTSHHHNYKNKASSFISSSSFPKIDDKDDDDENNSDCPYLKQKGKCNDCCANEEDIIDDDNSSYIPILPDEEYIANFSANGIQPQIPSFEMDDDEEEGLTIPGKRARAKSDSRFVLKDNNRNDHLGLDNYDHDYVNKQKHRSDIALDLIKQQQDKTSDDFIIPNTSVNEDDLEMPNLLSKELYSKVLRKRFQRAVRMIGIVRRLSSRSSASSSNCLSDITYSESGSLSNHTNSFRSDTQDVHRNYSTNTTPSKSSSLSKSITSVNNYDEDTEVEIKRSNATIINNTNIKVIAPFIPSVSSSSTATATTSATTTKATTPIPEIITTDENVSNNTTKETTVSSPLPSTKIKTEEKKGQNMITTSEASTSKPRVNKPKPISYSNSLPIKKYNNSPTFSLMKASNQLGVPLEIHEDLFKNNKLVSEPLISNKMADVLLNSDAPETVMSSKDIQKAILLNDMLSNLTTSPLPLSPTISPTLSSTISPILSSPSISPSLSPAFSPSVSPSLSPLCLSPSQSSSNLLSISSPVISSTSSSPLLLTTNKLPPPSPPPFTLPLPHSPKTSYVSPRKALPLRKSGDILPKSSSLSKLQNKKIEKKNSLQEQQVTHSITLPTHSPQSHYYGQNLLSPDHILQYSKKK